jgi:hypothetical protein
MTARASVLFFSLLLTAQADTLILKDGTKVTGTWWSIDASQVHFLVNNQLQRYPRADVSAVTFGDATLPAAPAPATPPSAPAPAPPAPSTPPSAPTTPPPAPSTPPSATPAQPSASAAPPARAPSLARPSDGPPRQAPTLTRPSGSAPPSTPQRGVSQPDEIGMVYFWNGRDLTPLERNQAVERGSGSAPYYEMPGPQSRVRLKEASGLVFVVRLPKGVDPASYSLFPLSTVNGSRRTRPDPGRRGGLLVWPFHIEINNESGYMTYAFTVKDLPTGEYSFSPTNSNDGYCFGVDPAAPGQ